MIGVGVIGYGYWGPNLVRNFADCTATEIAGVSDLSIDRLYAAQRRYPSIQVTTDYNDLLKSAEIDAIAISTPVSTHFDIAMAALKAGKHVLVEKPMAATSRASLRQPVAGSVSSARHCRTATAWSGTRAFSSCRRPPISTKHGLSAEPIRSTPPARAWARRV